MCNPKNYSAPARQVNVAEEVNEAEEVIHQAEIDETSSECSDGHGSECSCSECDTYDYENSCDVCVKGWGTANEFGLCECRCECGRSLGECRYSCPEYEEYCKTH